jgi:periplasmic divalent cation tolerance protein
MTDKIVVLTACDSEESARALARSLLEARLAACVNIVSGTMSLYWWQGAVEEAAEWILLIKSSRELFEPLRDHITREHTYHTPEAIALTIVDGSPDYLNWLERELRRPADA